MPASASDCERFGDCRDALEIWDGLGIAEPERLPILDTDDVPCHRQRQASLTHGRQDPARTPVSRRPRRRASTASTSPGPARCAGTDVAVIGTVDNTPIGVELALRMAGAVLEVVRDHPGRPILLLVDTQGQRLSHRDELLGINGYMAHLAKCLDLARRSGHRILGLV